MHDIRNRTDIDELVETFYGRVFADDQLGLIFTIVAHVTPETHFPLMGDFWETILFGQNRYHGNVILKHVELHLKQTLQPAHFDRWISLFGNTVDTLFAGPVFAGFGWRICPKCANYPNSAPRRHQFKLTQNLSKIWGAL